jgi:hypothetical protein
MRAVPPNLEVMALDSLESLPDGYWPHPIQAVPQEIDTVLLGWSVEACPILKRLNEDNLRSLEMQHINKQWEPFFEVLRAQGYAASSIVEVALFADDLLSSRLEGKEVPQFSLEEL